MARLLALSYPMILVLLAGSASGCAARIRTARLYDLDTARVLQASFEDRGRGQGPVTMTAPDGSMCVGEYATVPGGVAGWGAIFAGGRTGTVVTSRLQNEQPGMAVATCTDGVTIQCEYVTSARGGQGYGGCQDNEGRRYRLMF
jgi:hypothetical protein